MEIKFEHVDFAYQKVNCNKNEVFKDLNITFKEGKLYGIAGSSSSGKTRLLELIDGLIIPTNGQIKIGDFTLSSDIKKSNVNEIRSNIGIVFQNAESQFFNNTVYDEIAFSLVYHNYHIDEINKRVRDVIKMVGLNEFDLSKNPLQLSKGEKRKLAIAIALVHNPKILLLDEPTVGLDGNSKDSLIKLLRLLKNRYNKTIILSTHDTDFLHSIVDYVYVLNNKGIVLEGSKYDVFKETKKLKKYGVKSPKVIEFSNKVLDKKKIKIGYRDDINDLIKDIYRYVK